jgi:hypothetical protein
MNFQRPSRFAGSYRGLAARQVAETNPLLRDVPADEVLHALDAAGRRAVAARLVDRILSAMEAARVDLDPWQSEVLRSAVVALRGGANVAAIQYCRILLEKQGRRRKSLGASRPPVGLAELRDVLERGEDTEIN